MKFLYPEFLWALFTLAIPVIVHLFNFRKSKKIYFSNTRFLQSIKKEQTRKSKLKHLLILASRILFVAFLVFAFAQPYFPTGTKRPLSRMVYIYLDNSHSMTNLNDEERSLLDQSVEYVNEVAKGYPSGTEFRLLTNGFLPSSGVSKSKTQLTDALTELDVSPMSRSFDEVMNRIGFDLRKEQTNADVFLISDFQESTFPLEKVTVWQYDSLHQYFVVPLFGRTFSNVYVDSLYLSNPIFLPDQKNSLTIQLVNDSDEDKKSMNVQLFINEVQNAATSIDLPANSVETLNFELQLSDQRLHKGRLVFEDYPVTFDNELFFTLRLEKALKILELKGADQVTAIEQVFSNPLYFDLQSRTIRNIDYNEIRRSDLVVINEVDNISTSVQNEIEAFIEQGGTALIIPSIGSDFRYIEKLCQNTLIELDASQQINIEAPDYNNPFFANVFIEQQDAINMPWSKSVVTSDFGQKILSARDEVGFLTLFENPGKVFLLATPLQDEFTNFHRHSIFVPSMYKIAGSSREGASKLYFTIDNPQLTMRLDSVSNRDVLKLKNEDSEIIPSQYVVNGIWNGELPGYSLRTGIYDLMKESQLLDLLAFNYSGQESQLQQPTQEVLEQTFSTLSDVNFYSINSSRQLSKEVEKRKIGVSLWKQAVMLALLFLLIEILLIRFWK